jgi:hypothetical protein
MVPPALVVLCIFGNSFGRDHIRQRITDATLRGSQNPCPIYPRPAPVCSRAYPPAVPTQTPRTKALVSTGMGVDNRPCLGQAPLAYE